jgi:hypothetical protein
LVHRSAFASHVPHVLPAAPHAAVLCPAGAMQLLPEQHPPGHEPELHTHVPPEQVCPLPQAAVVPQRHTPALQVLVLPEHGTHAAPEVPHAAALWLAPVRHMPALQHPVGQLVESHTHAPLTQRWPDAHALEVPHRHAPAVQRSAVALHAAHDAPGAPHCAAVVGLTQVLPLQQPLGQLVALHTHAPATHCCPGPHAGFAPQRHAPPLHVSALALLQAVQALPPVPQVVSELVWHTPLRQHPAGQLAAVHPVQVRLVQVWGEGQL